MAMFCTRCGKEISLLGSLSYNKQTKRCGSCEKAIKQGLDRFRMTFLAASSDGVISPEEWAGLTAGINKDDVAIGEALAYVRGDAINLLERTLTFASADGMIEDEEERAIKHMQAALAIPDALARPIIQRLEHLKLITRIRKGSLPTVTASVRLDSGEICHMEMEATYHKVNAKSVTMIPGRLVATNKKLHFLSPTGGAEIAWKSVMRVYQQGPGVYIELSKKSGNGMYTVPTPDWAEAILDTLVRMAKRELIAPTESAASRHIPQDVKQAVWQRDQGKCIQCQANSYLEYDHIIPFSKGGASTLNNVQLLCRKCNLEKSDRI